MTLLTGLVFSGITIIVLGVWALCRAAGYADQHMETLEGTDRLSLLRRLERHRGWERR